MEPFMRITAIAAPLEQANIDSDMLIPVHFLRKPLTAGYGNFLFFNQRFDPGGNIRRDFILNQPPFSSARILVTGANFGCGSSREGAVFALLDFGIRAVIAPSFGPFLAANSVQNGLLPVVLSEEDVAHIRNQLQAAPGSTLTIDLPSQTVAGTDGHSYRFDIEPTQKEQLLLGLDDIDITNRFADQLAEFEKKLDHEVPWLSGDALKVLVRKIEHAQH